MSELNSKGIISICKINVPPCTRKYAVWRLNQMTAEEYKKQFGICDLERFRDCTQIESTKTFIKVNRGSI